MPIEKEKFFGIISEVSRSKGLDEDNLLERVKNELKVKDEGEYNKFHRDFSKEHQFSIKISEETSEDWTLLHLAAASNNLLIVQLLLKKKVSANARIKDGSQNDGMTALHIAAFHEHKSIVRQLLSDDRVIPSLVSKNKTPRDLVYNKENNQVIVQMLEEAEKKYLQNNIKYFPTCVEEESCGSPFKEHNTTQLASRNIGDEINPTAAIHTSNEVRKEHNNTIHSEQIAPNSSIDRSINNKEILVQNTFDTPFFHKLDNRCVANEDGNSLIKSIPPQVHLHDSKIQKLERPSKKLENTYEKIEKKTESKMAKYKTLLKDLNKLSEENLLLKQKIKNLEKINTIKSELSKSKAPKTELPFLAAMNLIINLTINVTFSIAFQLPVLLIIAASLLSSLIVSGVTYLVSTELKEVDIECSNQLNFSKT